jgi:ankyrin repeat protein
MSATVKVKGQELETAAFEGKTDEILRLWRDNGLALDVEHKDSNGSTPLHVAAARGRADACRALVSTCGANVDSRDSIGWTPLMRAARFNYLQCVEVLVELGADIALQNEADLTALEYAQVYPNAEVAAFLESAERIPMVKSALKI